ncbi:MAG: hypothetical protein NZ455_08600 [Bacteroidia bacterium]|nr:hypothetical protein [Bacteroidia bacterium]
MSLANARVGAFRTTLSLRCFANASHCLTACSMPLTQLTCAIMSLSYLSLKYKYLPAKTLYKLQRNRFFRDLCVRHAEGGR